MPAVSVGKKIFGFVPEFDNVGVLDGVIDDVTEIVGVGVGVSVAVFDDVCEGV
jgi:hypothetical protein